MSEKHHSPSVGHTQNFLTGAASLRRVFSGARLEKHDHVIEIGPGKGHLTRILLEKCGRVTAVEIDPRLAQRLREKFPGEGRLRIAEGDFLAWPLPSAGAYKVFANIPFSVTTAIVRKLTEAPHPPEEAWLIMERGAAMRFAGKPRPSLRYLALRPWFDAEITCRIGREEFHPAPRCDAAQLHLTRRTQPDLPRSQYALYIRFLTGLVGQGRSAFLRYFTPAQLSRALREAGLPHDFVPEEVRYIQWLCLFRCWRDYGSRRK